MPTWAKTTDRVIDNGFGASRGGQPVTGIVIHHVAGTNGRDYVANANSRNSHPTYHVASSGRVTGIVHPDRRPFSSGSIDVNAVTVEIDNSRTGDPWPVSDAALEAVASIIAHHANESIRSGHDAVKNKPGETQKGFWVSWHSQVARNGTECPGQYVRDHIDSIIRRANEIKKGAKPTPKPKPKPVDPDDVLGTPPKFPLPSTWYFGPRSGPVYSVSGYHGNRYGSAATMRSHLRTFQKQMQDRGWDFSDYGIDGLYGNETAGNTKAFQREKGLKVDGLIGPKTWAAAWTKPIT